AADVLFVGNSRLMFAFAEDVLTPFFAARGLRYYLLGFGHGESSRFLEELARRHDLRPRLVVANVDRFFTGHASEVGPAGPEESLFDARKVVFETRAAFWIRHRLHQVLPQIPDLLRGRNESIVYRSREKGSWRPALPLSGARRPLIPASERGLRRERPRV